MTLELVPWRGAQVPLLSGEVSRATLTDYFNWIAASQNYMGAPPPIMTSYGARQAEPISNSFEGFVYGMLYADGPVASAEAYRLRVFGQAPLLYQEIEDGRPGDLFDDPALDRLRAPWVGATLGDLMKRALIYGDFGGNAFILDLEDELVLVRPDWVEIILAKREYRGGQVGWKQMGIVYYEGGVGTGNGVAFLPGEYCHFVPGLPDPLATYRGMSWLTPLVREVQADKAAMDHKLAYFENSASPNLAVSLPKEVTPAQFTEFVELMDSKHKGAVNAGKTLYTGGGADVTVIGSNMQQQDFSSVLGKGETRVANAAGVPPVLLSFSEGMQGSSLNAGNYTAAKRNFVDTTMRDLWQNFAGSLQQMDAFKPREATRMWYDARDIPFLHEDAKDTAEIQQTRAATLNTHITAGWEPESAKQAVAQDDVTLLKHTGAFSVQLQPPGTGADADGDGQPDEPTDGGGADPFADFDFDTLRADLVRSDEELDRAYKPLRHAKGTKGGGRFRRLSDSAVPLLKDWAKGGGSSDPLGDEGFTRPQLRTILSDIRKQAEESGDADRVKRLTPRRGASEGEIKAMLYADASGKPMPQPAKKQTMADAGAPQVKVPSRPAKAKESGHEKRYQQSLGANDRYGMQQARIDDFRERHGTSPDPEQFAQIKAEVERDLRERPAPKDAGGGEPELSEAELDAQYTEALEFGDGERALDLRIRAYKLRTGENPTPEKYDQMWRIVDNQIRAERDRLTTERQRALATADLDRDYNQALDAGDRDLAVQLLARDYTFRTGEAVTAEKRAQFEKIVENALRRQAARSQRYRHGWIPITPLVQLPAEDIADEYGPELDAVELGEASRIVARQHGVTVESDLGDDIAIHAAPSPSDVERWADAIEAGRPYSRTRFGYDPEAGTVRFGDLEVDLDDEDLAQKLRDMLYVVDDAQSVPDDDMLDEPDGDETEIPDVERAGVVWAHEFVSRKFDPRQPRGRDGRWRLSGAVLDALKAQGGEQGAAHFDDGRYLDWSNYDPKARTYRLEVGGADVDDEDDREVAEFDLGDYEMEQLYNALAVTRLRDNPPPNAGPAVTALGTVGHSDHLVLDEDADVYIDWSDRTDAGDYRIEFSDGGAPIYFDLTPAEMDKLIASLALSTQDNEVGRARKLPDRISAGFEGGGRFRSASTRLIALLKDWNGEGDPFAGVSQASLKSAAEDFGLNPPNRAPGVVLKGLILKAHQDGTIARLEAEREAAAPATRKRVPLGPPRAALAKKMVKAYVVGASIGEIAEASGWSDSFVHRILTESGLQLRQRGGARTGRTGDTSGAKAKANALAAFAEGAPSAPDTTPEQQARQARDEARRKNKLIESRRATAALLAEVDQLLSRDADDAVIAERLDPALIAPGAAFGDADPDVLAVLSAAPDRASLRSAVTRMSAKSKIRPIGKAGQKLAYDPATMDLIGGDVPDGTRVQVSKRGATLALPDGPVLLDKAQVTAVPVKAARKVAPRKASVTTHYQAVLDEIANGPGTDRQKAAKLRSTADSLTDTWVLRLAGESLDEQPPGQRREISTLQAAAAEAHRMADGLDGAKAAPRKATPAAKSAPATPAKMTAARKPSDIQGAERRTLATDVVKRYEVAVGQGRTPTEAVREIADSMSYNGDLSETGARQLVRDLLRENGVTPSATPAKRVPRPAADPQAMSPAEKVDAIGNAGSAEEAAEILGNASSRELAELAAAHGASLWLPSDRTLADRRRSAVMALVGRKIASERTRWGRPDGTLAPSEQILQVAHRQTLVAMLDDPGQLKRLGLTRERVKQRLAEGDALPRGEGGILPAAPRELLPSSASPDLEGRGPEGLASDPAGPRKAAPRKAAAPRESVLGDGPMDEYEEALHQLSAADVRKVGEEMNISKPVGGPWPSSKAARIRYILKSIDDARRRNGYRSYGRSDILAMIESLGLTPASSRVQRSSDLDGDLADEDEGVDDLDDVDESEEDDDEEMDEETARSIDADTEDDEILRAMGDNELKDYWTKGKGLAKWANRPHGRWTALYRHLRKHVGPERAKRMAADWFHEVFGYWPGHQKGDNPVGPG